LKGTRLVKLLVSQIPTIANASPISRKVMTLSLGPRVLVIKRKTS